MVANKPSLLVYNSNLKPDEEVLAEFSVRQDIYESLFEAIQSDTMQTPEQHYLVVGQRGMGKTTLVNRLRLGIEQDETLNQWLMPVVLQEEQYQITELANLWEVVADYLEGQNEEAFAGLFDSMEAHYKRSDYERFCFELLSDRLHKAEKKIVLFIENFGEFLSKLSDIEQHRLREVLMMNNQIRLIGTSSVFLDTEKKRTYGQKNVEQNFLYDKPFWEFFRVITLEGLSKEEAQTLLRNLAKRYDKTDFMERILENSPGRIEVLRRLSGGVVRTMVLLFEIFLDDENGSALSDLNMVLDRITPLYKHRTDDLSVQQQKIIDAIARHWDSISTKEIAERTRLESKLVSAQLKQLSQNQLITTISTSNKNHLYQLSERFYNIWYLMRYGKRRDNSRVLWLVRFLEDWCDEEELDSRIFRLISQIKDDKITPESALYMAEVYLNMEKVDWWYRHSLHKLLIQTNGSTISYLTDTDEALYAKSEVMIQNGTKDKALQSLLKVRNPNNFMRWDICDLYAELDPKRGLEYMIENDFCNSDIVFTLFETVKYLSEQEAIEYLEKGIRAKEPGIGYYLVRQKVFKPENLQHLWDEIGNINTPENQFFYGFHALIKGDFDKSIQKIKAAFENYNFFENHLHLTVMKKVNEYFTLLLQKKQYHATYQLFQEFPELLKERFKPIWYALMVLMKDEFPDEHLRMPAELRETVAEIVQKITSAHHA